MAHYRATIDTPRPPEAVFAYLSDFSTTAEWDPGVLEAERIGELPVRMGTEFRLVASFLGRKSALTYRIIEFDPPKAVTLHGENSTVVSLDRIILEPHDGGTRLTYSADLALKGPLWIADPLLALALKRIGARALAGLRTTLRTQLAATPTTLAGHAAAGDRDELHENRGSSAGRSPHLAAPAARHAPEEDAA